MLEKVEFYIDARDSEKTTKLISNYSSCLRFGYHCCLIGSNRYLSKVVNRESKVVNREIYNNYLVQNFLPDNIIGKRYDYIFIDEYLAFDFENIKKCNDLLPRLARNIVIRTTAKQLVNKNIWRLVSDAREKSITHCLNLRDPEVNYLLNNLITHPKTSLITDQEYKLKNLSKNDYKIQILGDIFSD